MVQEVQAGNRKNSLICYVSKFQTMLWKLEEKRREKEPTHLAWFWPILAFMSWKAESSLEIIQPPFHMSKALQALH